MRESLAECIRGIASGLEVARDAIERKDWERASSATRSLLSFAGKLNQRIGVLTDFLEDAILEARAIAEVDRALSRGEPKGHQVTIDEAIAETKTPPARRRGGKGGKG